MLNKVKELLAKYKVHVAVVGGVLVVATTFGTCSFDASSTSDDAVEVVPSSNTTETTETTGTTETTETTGTTETTETTGTTGTTETTGTTGTTE